MDFPRFYGHIPSPPPPGSPLAYNEATIIGLISQIFSLLLRVGHIADVSDIVYPPEGGIHESLDLGLCAELNLDPAVISLLQHMPYFADGGISAQFAPGSYLPTYIHDGVLPASRKIGGLPDWQPGNVNARPPTLRPQDVVLLYQIDPDDMGETWVLDTEANTIRRYCLSTAAPGLDTVQRAFPSDYEPEHPEQPRHYRNAPALHAPTVLASYVDDLRSLLMMPGFEINALSVVFVYDYPETEEVRRRLLEDYGWPDEFREEDWAREKDDVWEEVRQWVYEHYGDDDAGREQIAFRYIPPWL